MPRAFALTFRVMRTVCMLLVFAVAACGKQEPVAPKNSAVPVAASAAVPAAKPAGFAIATARPDMYEGQLAIVLEFTQNVAGAQSFDSLLAVTGPKGEAITGSWALDENGKTLRFPFVEANKNYTVAIDGALAGADGKTLGQKVAEGNLYRTAATGCWFRLAGQRAAGARHTWPARGVGQRQGSRCRIPARARQGTVELLRRLPAQRQTQCLGSRRSTRLLGAQGPADHRDCRFGLLEPVCPRRQAEPARAVVSADPEHQRICPSQACISR